MFKYHVLLLRYLHLLITFNLCDWIKISLNVQLNYIYQIFGF